MDDSLSNGVPLGIAVDLTPLQPGGANGGIKPALVSMIKEAGRIAGDSLFFIFLTHSRSHGEVRRLARSGDLLVCVVDDPQSPLDLQNREREYLLPDPPDDFLRRIGADLLYAPLGACTYAVEGLPVVALIADLLHKDYPHTLNPRQIGEREQFIAHTLACASRVQCISRSGVERLAFHYDVPEEKMFFTYLPVQVRLEKNGSDEPNVPGLPSGPYFFYPANLWKHKNHETLLIAYRLYRHLAGERAWDLVLTFHEDDRAKEIRALCATLGIEAHVHTPGYVSEAGLREIWRKAGALVFPSLHEGFGIPLIEAMYYRAPIVSSPDFSLREIGGDAVLWIDPRKPESIADGLLKMTSDATLRETLRQRGERRLRFFDLTIETEKLIAVWRECAASRNGFPRKPLVLESNAALTLPTPASDALWTFEIRVSPQYPQNRYRCYLDEAAFGSFSIEQGTDFAFECRPRGRVLRVIVDRRARCGSAPVEDDAVEAVVAKNAEGGCIPLFELKKGDGL